MKGGSPEPGKMASLRGRARPAGTRLRLGSTVPSSNTVGAAGAVLPPDSPGHVRLVGLLDDQALQPGRQVVVHPASGLRQVERLRADRHRRPDAGKLRDESPTTSDQGQRTQVGHGIGQRIERNELGRVLSRPPCEPSARSEPVCEAREVEPAGGLVPADHLAVDHESGGQRGGERWGGVGKEAGQVALVPRPDPGSMDDCPTSRRSSAPREAGRRGPPAVPARESAGRGPVLGEAVRRPH